MMPKIKPKQAKVLAKRGVRSLGSENRQFALPEHVVVDLGSENRQFALPEHVVVDLLSVSLVVERYKEGLPVDWAKAWFDAYAYVDATREVLIPSFSGNSDNLWFTVAAPAPGEYQLLFAKGCEAARDRFFDHASLTLTLAGAWRKMYQLTQNSKPTRKTAKKILRQMKKARELCNLLASGG